MALTLTSIGGVGTVTGSKHLLSRAGKHILVDCGLFQGLKRLRELNRSRLPVAPKDLDTVVLTHAHLDHSDYLTNLVPNGFRGRIYATSATGAPGHENTILFSGFQAAGPRGQAMLPGANVKIHGPWVPVGARVASLATLSGHAASNELMRWLTELRHAPSHVFVEHGEPLAAEALRVRFDSEIRWSAVVPRLEQVFDL